MKRGLLLLLVFLQIAVLYAQEGTNSYVTKNGPQTIVEGGFEVIYSDHLYFGPNTDLVLDGDLLVYAKRIWIAPTARIRGSGTLTILSPAANPMYGGRAEQPTLLDANNSLAPLDVTLVIRNKNGLRLADMGNPGFAGVALPTGPRAAALRLSKSIDLAVNGANIYLNGHDLELGNTADILQANRERMIVTGDQPRGHLIKKYLGRSPFTFPVGIAPRDYTPATLAPATSGLTVSVTVTSYAAATSIDFAQADIDLGMDRVWNIYANEAVQMNYLLQHQSASNGVAYVDADARIMQNADAGNWIGDVTAFNGEGVHSRSDIHTRTQHTLSGTWFTKRSFSGPQANDDGPISLVYNREYEAIIPINVLENDRPGSSAIVVGAVRVVTPPVNGRTIVNADGSISYIPHEGYIGEDRFAYQITDENGRTDHAWVTVDVTPRDLQIPNVFTPNGDGVNDFFEIIGMERYDRVEVLIINRMGNEVYRSTNYDNTWNGDGSLMNTYFYLIHAHLGNHTRVFKGDVLIRRF